MVDGYGTAMQLIVFDVDGTLTHTTRVDSECFVRAIADEFGIQVNTDWAGYTHTTDAGITREIFERHCGRAPRPEEMARAQERFVRLLTESIATAPDCCTAMSGAAPLLERLRATDKHSFALATGSWRAAAMLKLNKAGLDHLDDTPAAFADDAEAREDIVRTAIVRAAHGCRMTAFSRIVCVGDAVWDVRAAHRLQLPFIGVGGVRREIALRQAGATHVLRDFSDIHGFLETVAVARIPSGPGDLPR